MNNNPNATGFSPVPNNLQSQTPLMDNSQNNREWQENNIVANRQAQGDFMNFAPGSPMGQMDAIRPQFIPVPDSQPPQAFGGAGGAAGMSPMSGASAGSLTQVPMQLPFGGAGPQANPYLQSFPQPQTATGTPYDRVQTLLNMQRMQNMQRQQAMQAAQRRDRSPMAFAQRFIGGAMGRPIPSYQARTAQALQSMGGMSKDDQEILLKAMNDGQGTFKDQASAQHDLAGDYNTGENNRMTADNNRYGHDITRENNYLQNQATNFGHQVTDRNGQRVYDASMYGHDVADRNGQRTYDSSMYGHDLQGKHNQAVDGLAQRTYNDGRKDLGTIRQQQLQDRMAEMVPGGKDSKGNPILVHKYAYPEYGPSKDLAAKQPAPSNGFLDPVAKFFGYVPQGGSSQSQAPAQPAPQASLPRPTKSNNVLDHASGQAYLDHYGSKEAARAAAIKDGWRTR